MSRTKLLHPQPSSPQLIAVPLASCSGGKNDIIIDPSLSFLSFPSNPWGNAPGPAFRSVIQPLLTTMSESPVIMPSLNYCNNFLISFLLPLLFTLIVLLEKSFKCISWIISLCHSKPRNGFTFHKDKNKTLPRAAWPHIIWTYPPFASLTFSLSILPSINSSHTRYLVTGPHRARSHCWLRHLLFQLPGPLFPQMPPQMPAWLTPSPFKYFTYLLKHLP